MFVVLDLRSVGVDEKIKEHLLSPRCVPGIELEISPAIYFMLTIEENVSAFHFTDKETCPEKAILITDKYNTKSGLGFRAL